MTTPLGDIVLYSKKTLKILAVKIGERYRPTGPLVYKFISSYLP